MFIQIAATAVHTLPLQLHWTLQSLVTACPMFDQRPFATQATLPAHTRKHLHFIKMCDTDGVCGQEIRSKRDHNGQTVPPMTRSTGLVKAIRWCLNCPIHNLLERSYE